MAKKKKYYQGKKARANESRGAKMSGNESWFGVSEGDNGQPPMNVISRVGSSYNGNSMYYEQGAAYQEKECQEMERGAAKQKLNGHF